MTSHARAEGIINCFKLLDRTHLITDQVILLIRYLTNSKTHQ